MKWKHFRNVISTNNKYKFTLLPSTYEKWGRFFRNLSKAVYVPLKQMSKLSGCHLLQFVANVVYETFAKYCAMILIRAGND